MELGSSRWLERDPCNGQADGVNTVELARIVRDIQLDLCPNRLEFKLRGETMEEFRVLREDYRQRERVKAGEALERSRVEVEAEQQREAARREAEEQEWLRAYSEKYGLDRQAVVWPSPRTGGIYDQPLVLRAGIDDLFMSFGQFVSCMEQTLGQLVAQGQRPQELSGIEITVERNDIVLFFRGVAGEHIRLQLTALGGHVLLRRIEMPHRIVYAHGSKWLIVSYLTSTCSD